MSHRLHRILLVDDSALVRNSMQTALEAYGVEFGHAENGAVAVELAATSRWDLIFLDVVMPIMDGPAALHAIRARGDRTPVVLVTSVSTAAVVASAVRLGNVQYVGKPFTPELIRALAAKTLHLDPTVLACPPRVLVQHTDPTLPRRLAKVLPPHVAIDASDALATSIDLAEERDHGLVLIESNEPVEEHAAIAAALRRVAPDASCFSLSDAATDATHDTPTLGLAGVLPRALTDGIGRGLLYASFLRQLVYIHDTHVDIAGYQGPMRYRGQYLARVERLLIERCADLADSMIDMSNVNGDSAEIGGLIDRVNQALRAAGAAPTFRLGANRAEVAPHLGGALVAA